MKFSIRIVSVFFCLSRLALAQPAINAGGVANIASMAPDGLPNSGIAQGSIFVVNGTGLGAPNPNPLNLFQNAVYPLPASQGLNGTTVQIGTQPIYGIMLYESDTMLAVILPSSTPTGATSVTVAYNGQTSNSVTIHVVQQAFGLFTYGQYSGNPGLGYGPGLIEQFDSSGNSTLNSFDAPAVHGQTILLLGTGLGPVSGDESQGPATGGVMGVSDVTLQIYIGGEFIAYNPTSGGYAGRYVTNNGASFAGIDVIEIQLPQPRIPPPPEGCYLPVEVIINGVVSNTTTMSIDPSGTVCSDPQIGYSQADLQQIIQDQASRIGTFTVSSLISPGTGVRSDTASAGFVNMSLLQFRSAPGAYPSPGACAVITFSGNSPPLSPTFLGTPMDAGPSLNLNGPDGFQQLMQLAGQITYGSLTSSTPMIDPGSYSLDNGGGGADVGPFQANLSVPAAPQMFIALSQTNTAGITVIPTDDTLPVGVRGSDPNSLLEVIGFSVDVNTQVGALFECTSGAGAQTVPVGSDVLSWLPTTSTSSGLLIVANIGRSRFPAPGLETGYFTYLSAQGIPVQYVPKGQVNQ